MTRYYATGDIGFGITVEARDDDEAKELIGDALGNIRPTVHGGKDRRVIELNISMAGDYDLTNEATGEMVTDLAEER